MNDHNNQFSSSANFLKRFQQPHKITLNVKPAHQPIYFKPTSYMKIEFLSEENKEGNSNDK